MATTTQANAASAESAGPGPSQADVMLFWGCFIAMICTSIAFVTRTILVNGVWISDFNLDKVRGQELFGAGIWPFAISIILFSFVIDQIGYKTAMFFSFVCYAVYAALALLAYSTIHAAGLQGPALTAAQNQAYSYLYTGSVILGLGNGTVEAFSNPVVATIFSREKPKWLNRLHAGWAAGLVIGGVITVALGEMVKHDWRIVIYILALPAIVYIIMLAPAKFPIQERVASGTTYKEMLAEFGVIGCFIAAFLVFRQFQEALHWAPAITYVLIALAVVAYGVYSRSLGRPLMIALCLIMMPLATTELGTDGAITGIMEEPMKASGFNPAWVLIYTSFIMLVLRFFSAGPLVKRLTPIGLLMCCATLAIFGLNLLAYASGLVFIFAAATLYGLGKTYFWPTMLSIVSEQFPRGGALTLNAIAGIGMLTVGIIGGPMIGHMQEIASHNSIDQQMPGVYQQVSHDSSYILGHYMAIDEAKVSSLPDRNVQQKVQAIDKTAKQRALSTISIFPGIMLLGYICLFIYFRSRGGYHAVELSSESVEEEGLRVTGGFEGPVEA